MSGAARSTLFAPLKEASNNHSAKQGYFSEKKNFCDSLNLNRISFYERELDYRLLDQAKRDSRRARRADNGGLCPQEP